MATKTNPAPKKVAKPAPDPAAVQAAVNAWYAATKSAIDQAYRTAGRMAHAMRDGNHPLCAVLDYGNVTRLYAGLEEAANALSDITPMVGDPMPDPLDALGG